MAVALVLVAGAAGCEGLLELYRVNAGGDALTDAQGRAWEADTYYRTNTGAFSRTYKRSVLAGDPPHMYNHTLQSSTRLVYWFPGNKKRGKKRKKKRKNKKERKEKGKRKRKKEKN
mgnify:CR=1 FL=1